MLSPAPSKATRSMERSTGCRARRRGARSSSDNKKRYRKKRLTSQRQRGTDGTKARQFVQAALGRLRREESGARNRDDERSDLAVHARVARDLPAAHVIAQPDVVLRGPD